MFILYVATYYCYIYMYAFSWWSLKSQPSAPSNNNNKKCAKCGPEKSLHDLPQCFFLFIYFCHKPKSTHTRYTIHIYIYRMLWFSYWMWRGWMDGIKFICDCKHSVRFRLFPFFLTFSPYGFWSRIRGTHLFLTLCFWCPKANCLTRRACFSQVVFYLF